MKFVQVSDDLYNTIQKLKEVFYEMDDSDKKGKKPGEVFKDDDVISILVGGFIDSLGKSITEVFEK